MDKKKGQSLRIVFMGTPDFAVYALEHLITSVYNIVAVVTTPDKPAGRGRKLRPSPVKLSAQNHNIHLLQPEKLKDEAFIHALEALRPDLFIVVAFRILPKKVWAIPTMGTVNLHASILPDYRGAAPINWAIINGEKTTGVTTFFIDEDVDTGKVIYMDEAEITPDMNAGELHDILMHKGAGLLERTIDSIADETNPAIQQKEMLRPGETKNAPKIHKDNCRINWNNDIDQLYNFIRGLSPYPGAWTILKNDNAETAMKIYHTKKEKVPHQHQYGQLFTDHKKTLKVAVPNGFIHLQEIQLAGKKKMNVPDFLMGYKGLCEIRFTS